MSLPCRVFSKRILNRDSSVGQKLPIHAFDCQVTCLEGIILDKAKALAATVVQIADNMWSFNNRTKCTEGVIQHLFVHFVSQVANEQVGSNISGLFVVCGF
jgi:hypothetical protein